jgi:AraC-like DNA-binding protein
MNTKMKHIQNWPELAKEANWRAAALAKKCGVSVRTLERHFLKEMGKSPTAWIAEQRRQLEAELLLDGSMVKEVAERLGYKNQHHFSREFKRRHGHPPSQEHIASKNGSFLAEMSRLDTECRI